MATAKLSSVIIDVRLGECLALSDVVTVELVQKSGQLARLRVTAPREVKIEKKPCKDAKRACQA
jgi:sRNA-binding carbon storage regulator CsrA